MSRSRPKQKSSNENSDFDMNLARKDKDVVCLIEGLNTLIVRASDSHMGMAVRIFHLAKEELVHWAVDMNFHETAKERFVNQHLYNLKPADKEVVREMRGNGAADGSNQIARTQAE